MKKTCRFQFLLIAISFFGFPGAWAQPGIINTVAGNHTEGFGGDGGPAIDAEFSGPAGLALDASGNLYIADFVNNRIRKVVHTTGIITTIAGTGDTLGSSYGGYSGDGGPATGADLYNPTGIVLDASGNIFFSDQGNHRIRKIDVSTGIITTVAGNGTAGYTGDGIAATALELYYPCGITLDSAGNLYIADWQNNRIRKVVMSTGIITTIAGTGDAGYSGDGGPATAAKFNKPSGLTFDASGNLYISEYGNNTVRKIVMATGIVTTIAGSGVPGYTGDGGAAATAQLFEPLAVRTDTAGNLYIADWRNYVVRVVWAATGIITTIAGDNINSYSGDGGPATSAGMSSVDGMVLDVHGNLLVSDELNNVIREIQCPACVGLGVPSATGGRTARIYPNPAANLLTIESPGQPINHIAIFDIVGQEVFAHSYDAKLVAVDIANLKMGVYFLKVDGAYVSEFVKE